MTPKNSKLETGKNFVLSLQYKAYKQPFADMPFHFDLIWDGYLDRNKMLRLRIELLQQGTALAR